jgi:hypothetical protein
MTLIGRRYPSDYRIDDWDNPWLPAPIRLLNVLPDVLTHKLFAFEEADLLASARKVTGLHDFGDEDFLLPLRLLLEDFRERNHFTPMGRITVKTILHQQLCARLCLEQRFKLAPEIAQAPIDRPLIIAGLPRTGTTHLHNLLSRIPSLRYLPLWQTLHPAPPLPGRPDRRRQVTAFSMTMTHYILPLLMRMHELETDLPHEELTVCALCYRSFFFEGAFDVPGYRQWYASNEHEKGYDYLKRTLQILQQESAPEGRTAATRWVLKSPQHLDQLETILQVFPDAKLILTHRDPLRAVVSMITMMAYTSRQVYRPTRLRENAHAWVDRLEQMLRRSQAQVQRIPNASVLNVDFNAFMADAEGTVRRVCEFAGVELDAAALAAVRDYLSKNVRDRHGRIEYRFEDLGLNEGEIRERFAFYRP